MGIISYIDNLLFKITEDETEKWLRFHDDLDKRYATGRLQERPREFSPTPIVEISETEKLLNPNYRPKINSLEVTRKEKVFRLLDKKKISTERAKELLDQIDKPEPSREDANPPMLGEDKMETYYVVEVNGRYYENETVLYSDTEIFEHSVSTTKSLLECKRFYSKADAQKTADKHGFVVRKVKVECE